MEEEANKDMKKKKPKSITKPTTKPSSNNCHESMCYDRFGFHHYQSRRNNIYYQADHHHHHHHQSLLPLPLPLPLPPPPVLLHLPLPPHHYYHAQKTKTHFQKFLWKQRNHQTKAAVLPLPHQDIEVIPKKLVPVSKSIERKVADATTGHHQKILASSQAMVVEKRPDSGGTKGSQISLLANHFLVKFDSTQKIFHYDVEITPKPSKETARMIKRRMMVENSDMLRGALPVFDGRRNLYSPVEFQQDRIEFFVSLMVNKEKRFTTEHDNVLEKPRSKLFRVNIKLVSKLDGEELSKYLKEEGDAVPLPQDYLHALDVVLRESSMENCIPMGRSIFTKSMGGPIDIGSGAVGLRGFFQSLRPTQQGLALNVDFSVTAFHESIGIIPYLQKRCEFLKDLSQRKTKGLIGEEKKEVEKALKNIRIFVRHRETDQKYRIYSLTNEATENLKFKDRDGKDLMLVDYFKDHYNLEIQFRKLPCLQLSRSRPCYLPMELCMVCEGQKFFGKLSDDQTARILKMGCQHPQERKEIINAVVGGPVGPTSGPYESEFDLHVSKEMSQLSGRVLQPPKLKFGDGGQVKEFTPSRRDRQWNLLESHVAEGSRIRRWALISFGGTQEQQSCIPKFINHLSSRCQQLGIFLDKSTVISPLFEHIQVLNNVSLLEHKLKKIQEATGNNLQLLICVMEKKHKGYADLKRIAETSIGLMSQCCLYANVTRLSSQFLANLALKINAKLGGCNVTLYHTLSSHIPRLFSDTEPVILMGADVTHPHPLDDHSPSVAAVVGSMNWPSANKYISRMRSQTHRQEIIEEMEQMVHELLEDFRLSVHKLPNRIIFFRDGVSETQFHKVLKEELRTIQAACRKFPNYKPSITFIVVQKRHHTRLFLNDQKNKPTENIPPGTVVDTVITHPREFDFYLCSHWGLKGTSRPTHYHVLWDENRFKSDELQQLIHNLCYTFVRCMKPVSLVPPAYYAHLAAYRGRLYLEKADSFCRISTMSRAGVVQTMPLPKLRDNVKNFMFYC